jgi:hypothetical protein
MDYDALVGEAAPALERSGFRLVRNRPNLPFGDKQQIFSNGGLDLEIVKDRDRIYVGLAEAGNHTLGYQAWARALGIPYRGGQPLLEQIMFFLQHLDAIHRFVATVPDADARVTAENWRIVAPQIGLDPNRPPPGTAG